MSWHGVSTYLLHSRLRVLLEQREGDEFDERSDELAWYKSYLIHTRLRVLLEQREGDGLDEQRDALAAGEAAGLIEQF